MYPQTYIRKIFSKEEIVMSVAIDLLKSDFIGIKELRASITTDKLKNTLILTDRGKPVSVSVPYNDMLELLDILDEISDVDTSATVLASRKARKNGTKGVSVLKAFAILSACI